MRLNEECFNADFFRVGYRPCRDGRRTTLFDKSIFSAGQQDQRCFGAGDWGTGRGEDGGTAAAEEDPVANPGRPTVSTPATLTPVGYLQFETGILAAWHSPEFSSQASINEVIKFAVSRRVQFLAASEPLRSFQYAARKWHGGVSLGVQGVLWPGEGARPTLSTSYFPRGPERRNSRPRCRQRHVIRSSCLPAPM